jgi:pyruvate/2-oxoglutarate dehydrogenase complex dihydrolipoamide acyltransferase (E2) component
MNERFILPPDKSWWVSVGLVKQLEQPAPKKARVIDATDSARQLAVENAVDLWGIEGTGTDGRIIKADVQRALS